MSSSRPTPVVPPPGDARSLVGAHILGRYVVKQVLGVGGKGTVYEAEDVTMRRAVAIKVPAESTEDFIKRFLREGRAGAAVAHPNVCAIYDFGPLDDGTPFLVMERLLGETLAQRLLRPPRLSLPETLSIVQQVLSGLSAAHGRGIIHRDIKPANILLTTVPGYEEIVPKILDFGASTLDPAHAAVQEQDFESLTMVGTAIGTPLYMAPEQVRGERDLDARLDVYACGVMLYEALSGRPPHVAKTRPELFRRILDGKAAPPSSFAPAVPMEMDAIVAKAMAPVRSERYPSAAAFAAALEPMRHQLAAGGAPTVVAAVPETERLMALQQRFTELSSHYLSPESQAAMRPSRQMTVSEEIPIDFVEEDSPATTRDPGFEGPETRRS